MHLDSRHKIIQTYYWQQVHQPLNDYFIISTLYHPARYDKRGDLVLITPELNSNRQLLNQVYYTNQITPHLYQHHGPIGITHCLWNTTHNASRFNPSSGFSPNCCPNWHGIYIFHNHSNQQFLPSMNIMSDYKRYMTLIGQLLTSTTPTTAVSAPTRDIMKQLQHCAEEFHQYFIYIFFTMNGNYIVNEYPFSQHSQYNYNSS